MGSRPLGELMLRPTSLSRISLAQNFRAATPSWSIHRTITKSTTPQAAQSQGAERKPSESIPYQPSGQDKTNETIDNLFSEVPAFARRAPMSRGTGPLQNSSTAAQARNVFGANFSQPRSVFQRRTTLDLDAMTGLPSDLLNPKPVVPQEPENPVYPRLNPAYGRTVELAPEQGRDLVRGINMLGSLVARNRVVKDFYKQKYHERPGLKRKRLKSERWRARFKQGFKDVTARVSELTRKGW